MILFHDRLVFLAAAASLGLALLVPAVRGFAPSLQRGRFLLDRRTPPPPTSLLTINKQGIVSVSLSSSSQEDAYMPWTLNNRSNGDDRDPNANSYSNNYSQQRKDAIAAAAAAAATAGPSTSSDAQSYFLADAAAAGAKGSSPTMPLPPPPPPAQPQPLTIPPFTTTRGSSSGGSPTSAAAATTPPPPPPLTTIPLRTSSTTVAATTTTTTSTTIPTKNSSSNSPKMTSSNKDSKKTSSGGSTSSPDEGSLLEGFDVSALTTYSKTVMENMFSGDFGKRGEGYVATQFVLLFCIGLGNVPVIGGLLGWLLGPGLLLAGIGVIVTGMLELGNALTPWPTPSPNYNEGLITTGIYSKIRHPIYAGLLASCAGFAILTGSAMRLLLTAVLLVVLDMKSSFEESELIKTYPDDYPAYKKDVAAKFFPQELVDKVITRY